MAKKLLTTYNTLTEALAFNLTYNDHLRLGYIEYQSMDNIRTTYKTMFRLYDKDGSFDVNKWSITTTNPIYSHYHQKDSFIEEFEDTQCFRRYFGSINSVPLTGQTKYDIMAHDQTRRLFTKDNITTADGTPALASIAKEGCIYEYTTSDWNRIDQEPTHGEYIDTYYTGIAWSHLPFRFELLTTRQIQQEDNTILYSSFKDFRWLENKKIITLDDFTNNTIYNLANLIPEYSLMIVCKNDTIKTALEAELNTLKDNVETYDKFNALIKKISGTNTLKYNLYYIAYRSDGYLYLFSSAFNLNSLFVYNDTGEDYPLNRNGYIDYNAIDYRKTYTKALGAAKIHPRVIQKFDCLRYTAIDPFTNKPKLDQGQAYKVSITSQMFKTGYNDSTLTVVLGYTEVDGVTYNDELGRIYGENDLIGIVNNNDNTYSISFKKTTEVVTEILNIEIKNTFTNVYSVITFDLDCVIETQHELVKAKQTKYSNNQSNNKTVNGYIYYERDTPLTDADLAALNQADVNAAYKYATTNFITIAQDKDFNPIEFTSCIAMDNEFLIRFVGIDMTAKTYLTNLGTYIYDITSNIDNVNVEVEITIYPDAGDDNPKKDIPPGDGGEGGNGGGSSGGGVGGGYSGGSGGGGNGGGISIPPEDDHKIDGNNEDPETNNTPVEPESCKWAPADEDGNINLKDLFDYDIVTSKVDNGYPIIVKENPGKGESTGWDNHGGFAISWNETYGCPVANARWLFAAITTTKTLMIKNEDTGEKIPIAHFSTVAYKQSGKVIGSMNGGSDDGDVTTDPFQASDSDFGSGKEVQLPNDVSNYKAFFDIEGKFSADGIFDGREDNLIDFKFKQIRKSPFLESSTGYIELEDGTKLCVYYEGMSQEEWLQVYYDKDELAGSSDIETYESLVTLTLPTNDGTSKDIGFGTYSFKLDMEDANGNKASVVSDFNYAQYQGKTFNFGYTTKDTGFDHTNVTKKDFTIIDYTDPTGGKLK